MAKLDVVGYEQAASISLNYALDSVEAEILDLLKSDVPVTHDTLRRVLSAIKRQRISHKTCQDRVLQ